MKKAAVPSILVAVVLLAVGVIAEAQQTKKVPLIDFLDSGTPSSSLGRAEALRLAGAWVRGGKQYPNRVSLWRGKTRPCPGSRGRTSWPKS